MPEEQEAFEDAAEAEDPVVEQPNAADAKGVRAQRKLLKQQAAEEEAVFKQWLSTEAGRRVYARLVFDTCNLHGPSVRMNAHGVFDPLAGHFEEGRRAVGKTLQSEALQKAKTQYMLLIQENFTKYGVG